MNAGDDQLGDVVVRLMYKGVYLNLKDGELQISGGGANIAALDPSDIRLLRNHKDDIARLVTLNSEKPGGEACSVETYEGRFLGRHLVPLWQRVDSGESDEFFTNLTHGISRLPKPISTDQFLQAVRLMIERHPALSLTLTGVADELYRIGFADFSQMDIRVEGASEAVSDVCIKAQAAQLIAEKLDNKKGMVRLFLLQSKDSCLIGVVINHFVSDLRSVANIMRELVAASYGQQSQHAEQSVREEHEFIREISDLYDYSSDPRFALTRAFWRDVTSKGRYRNHGRSGTRSSNRSTNIKFFIEPLTTDAFIRFTKEHGLTPLGVMASVHARAQQQVFGDVTTVAILTTRNRVRESTSVGKMDDVKPMNVQFEDIVSCAKRVNQYRSMTQRFRFFPSDLFPELFYGGRSPLVPFLNLIVADNIGRRDFYTEASLSSTGIIETITYEGGADQRFEFEDYSLQLAMRETGMYGMLSFSHDSLSEEVGEALVRSIMNGFKIL